MVAKRATGSNTTPKDASLTAKSLSSPEAGRALNALQQPLDFNKHSTVNVGATMLPPSESLRRLWAYIKANKLQNLESSREIVADVFISNMAARYLPNTSRSSSRAGPAGGRKR